LQLDDLCGCNSGKRYGECHMPIFDAPGGEMLQVARSLYVEEWSANADGRQRSRQVADGGACQASV
ncbi:MAG: SEC-C domain-containing protein, partial [Proteobacteria bacterium]|nr:SEC-C domain-containing protein [Pseudomonadota bacterium]